MNTVWTRRKDVGTYRDRVSGVLTPSVRALATCTKSHRPTSRLQLQARRSRRTEPPPTQSQAPRRRVHRFDGLARTSDLYPAPARSTPFRESIALPSGTLGGQPGKERDDSELADPELAEWRRRLEGVCPGCGLRTIGHDDRCSACGARREPATSTPRPSPHVGARRVAWGRKRAVRVEASRERPHVPVGIQVLEPAAQASVRTAVVGQPNADPSSEGPPPHATTVSNASARHMAAEDTARVNA